MSVIENKNFTNFQNVNLKGTDGDAGSLRLAAVGGDGKTISFVQGNGEAQYLTVAEGLRLGSGYISLQSRNTEGTLSTSASLEAARAWQLPNISGAFTIGGSFNVQLPAATKNIFSTIVTVSGVRANDAVTVTLAEGAGTYVYGSGVTMHVLTYAKPGNGNITLHFYDPGQGTGYIELVGSYTAVRT